MRLERAAQLLDAQAGTVVEVAYSVGFKSVAHFSNAFKDLVRYPALRLAVTADLRISASTSLIVAPTSQVT
jgi:transcriptional regulator GlxA family with amidase domain